jgi:hypothetical protein
MNVTSERDFSSRGAITKVTCLNETSIPIFIPKDNVGLDLVIVSGTAVIEQTSSLPSEVQSGAATWFPWGPGTVGANVSSIVFGGTAVRLKATVGSAHMYVRS